MGLAHYIQSLVCSCGLCAQVLGSKKSTKPEVTTPKIKVASGKKRDTARPKVNNANKGKAPNGADTTSSGTAANNRVRSFAAHLPTLAALASFAQEWHSMHSILASLYE
jgi:hypothetical protein